LDRAVGKGRREERKEQRKKGLVDRSERSTRPKFFKPFLKLLLIGYDTCDGGRRGGRRGN
jgi:hypothetical protein